LYHLSDTTENVESTTLRRMTDCLAHRGPDAVGTWRAGEVGLGHRLLWTTPESLVEQFPLVSGDGRRVLTADARIDNRDALFDALDIAFDTNAVTDGALILAAYERWGDGCVDHLLGDFAFAIWDADRELLFCARDHVGVKPFYYYRSHRLFAFASEIKALFRVPEVPREINEPEIAYYVTSAFGDPTVTAYRNIHCLPAARAMTISVRGVDVRRYWALDPSRTIRYDTDEEYEQAFRELFTEAVRCRLRSAFPVGVELSGGLDSSSVVCVARDVLRREGVQTALHTFSATYTDVPQCDESAYRRPILSGGDLIPHDVHPDRLSTLTDVDEMLQAQEGPLPIPNMFMSRALLGAARETGVRVLLDGENGDDVVSHGAGCLTELLFDFKWRTFLRELNGFAKRVDAPRRLILWHNEIMPALDDVTPEPVREAWRRLHRRPPSPGDQGFLRAEFSKQIDWKTTHPDAAQLPRYRPSTCARDWHYFGISHALTQAIVQAVDKAAAAFSIELRHPFYDVRLLEFCLALPPEQKIKGSWPRSIVRRALASLLPPDVCWRMNKANLGSNFRRCLLTFDRERVERVLTASASPTDCYLDRRRLRQAYDDCVAGKQGDEFMLWKMMILERWLSDEARFHATAEA
jgi:asparagine synthase (glutamine-hydrolysing)